MVYGMIDPVNDSCSGSLRLFGNRCASDEQHQAVNQLDGKKTKARGCKTVEELLEMYQSQGKK
jgi:hypothetical protein